MNQSINQSISMCLALFCHVCHKKVTALQDSDAAATRHIVADTQLLLVQYQQRQQPAGN
jgi:hypothetical protein